MSAMSSMRKNRRFASEHPQPYGRPAPVSQVNWAPPSRLEKKWMVYVEGGEVVGPVSADQIARGIKAGVIPMEASVQAAGEVFWDGVLDNVAVISALKSL
jgi:hypothetical protein